MRGSLPILLVACHLTACACVEIDLIGQTDTSVEPPVGPRPDAVPDMALDIDVPEVEDDGPVAVLEGPPVPLREGDLCCRLVELDWNGSGWGVMGVQTDLGLLYRPLDSMASPLGSWVVMPHDCDVGHVSLAWGDDRFAFTYSYRTSPHFCRDEVGEFVELGTIDARGNLLSGITPIADDASEPDIAWSDDAGAWLVGYADGLTSLSADDAVLAALASDESTVTAAPVNVGSTSHSHGPRIAMLESLSSMTWVTEDGIWHRSFRWPAVESYPEATMIHAMSATSDHRVEVEGFHDYTVVVLIDRADVLSLVVEPEWGIVVSGPRTIDRTAISERTPSITAAPDRGYLGLCYPVVLVDSWGAVTEEFVVFRLITPDGRPLGSALHIASGTGSIADCTVGWSGTEFLVLYWGHADRECFLHAQRVRPLI